ncbi:hypothetical protein ASPTUDRAFT_113912 [Aspergillus tubingensis CBS 134.48]|uniref:Uncharacterized protein n=1 Tax=Aspergillus tubingensis (strain CBS 134.48) TaxID=767770 RepID=A0A1L9NM66_ASPTC|nr:hypothetical protein ASPTUDRAFT_113912 [Aspergillus tubingensis CBS 134.48]
MAGKGPIAMETRLKTTKRVITVVRLQETCYCAAGYMVIVSCIDVINPLEGAFVAYHLISGLAWLFLTLTLHGIVFLPRSAGVEAIPCTGFHGFGAATSFSFLFPSFSCTSVVILDPSQTLGSVGWDRGYGVLPSTPSKQQSQLTVFRPFDLLGMIMMMRRPAKHLRSRSSSH